MEDMNQKTSCCKVGRTSKKYGLDDAEQSTIDDRLKTLWLGGRGSTGRSVRDLTDYYNKTVLKEVYIQQSRDFLSDHLESDYEMLTGDDDAKHAEVVDSLKADGIDAEELVDDFVSAPTLYRHLTDCLELDKGRAESEDWEENSLSVTYRNTQRYVANILDSWDRKGVLPHASHAETTVRIYLECPVCDTQTTIERAQRRGYVCADHMTEETGPPGE